MNKLVDVKNISFSYDKDSPAVFENISFSIEKGDVLCVLGPNGTGKTTLIKCINGLHKVNEGEVYLNGSSIQTLSFKDISRMVGYIPQGHVPSFPFNVFDVVLMGRSPYLSITSSPKERDREIAMNALETLGIEDLKDKPYTNLSGGERQLVFLARVLAQEPDLLILDEPTNHLDFGNQIKLLEIIDKGHDVIGKVDETIFLARLESGSETAINEPYSVTTLICDISDGMINKLSDKPIKFLVDLGDNIPDILVGDFDKIKSVLEILLDNSIKYTKEGTITLSVDYYELNANVENESSRLIFSVSDTGIGISEDRLEHIFEIYYVDESKLTGTSTGKGVSLSIAKKISDILGGELEAESTYGAGATFTFSIEQGKLDTTGNVIPLNDNTVERVSREEAEKMWAPDLSVLLVDDVQLSRSVAEDVIKSMEIKCDTAESGVGAIDMVMTNKYDMVFMDIAMPVMNGIDALKEIRELSDDYYKELPVIAMSEDVIGKNRQEIIDEGFSDVILKPFDITVLASLINRFADKDKIKYKTNDVAQYISESRYGEGLKRLEDYLDVVGVLDRIGGNIEVYNKILSTFYSQNKDSRKELGEKLHSDFRGFRNKIHSIRTGCQNIGAIDAAEIALRIENALNLGNRIYAENNLYQIYDCITVINELIEDYLDFVNDKKGVTDKELAEKIAKVRDTENLIADEYLEEAEELHKKEEASLTEENLESHNEYDDEYEDYNDSEEVEESEAEDQPEIIDISKLRLMKEAVFAQDIDKVNSILEDISNNEYGNEDQEFINALKETISSGDFIEIDDLLNTYIDLKENI